jgi:hypothetical protein
MRGFSFVERLAVSDSAPAIHVDTLFPDYSIAVER